MRIRYPIRVALGLDRRLLEFRTGEDLQAPGRTSIAGRQTSNCRLAIAVATPLKRNRPSQNVLLFECLCSHLPESRDHREASAPVLRPVLIEDRQALAPRFLCLIIDLAQCAVPPAVSRRFSTTLKN